MASRIRYTMPRIMTKVRKVTPPGMKKTLSNYKWAAMILGGLFVWLMVKGKVSPQIIKESFMPINQN